MLTMFTRNWWALALRGTLAIAFGIMALAFPQVTLRFLVYLFGAYALVDGLFAMIQGVRQRQRDEYWWTLALEGIVGGAIGWLTCFWPGATAAVAYTFIAAWAILTGMLEIAAAIQLRRVISGDRLLALSGILAVAFGVLMAAFPRAGALTVVWLIGAYSIVVGILLTVLAFRLRSLMKTARRAFQRAFSAI